MYNNHMETIDIKNHFKTPLFTHEMLSAFLEPSVSQVNIKIATMVKNGDLIRLKRGVYHLGKRYQSAPIDTISISNMLYTPSYVSFDFALSHYGMIPERVSEVTAATLNHAKLFETPLGRFSYKHIPKEAYALGIDWVYDENNGGKLIATPEKALCDKIRYDRGVGSMTQAQMKEYLLYDLRLERLEMLNVELILSIAHAYRSKNLRTLAFVLQKGVNHGE